MDHLMQGFYLNFPLALEALKENRPMVWPVSLLEYAAIENTVLDTFFKNQDPGGRDLVTTPYVLAALREGLNVAVRLLTRALEIQQAENKGLSIVYDVGRNPITHALYESGSSGVIIHPYIQGWQPYTWKEGVKKNAARKLRKLRGCFKDAATFNLPPLASQFILEQSLKTAFDPFYERRVDVMHNNDEHRKVSLNWSQKLVSAFSVCCPLNDELSERTQKLIADVFYFLLGQMYGKWVKLTQIKDTVISPCLVTGTPKNFGLLVSHFYLSQKRPVIRFSHGGERGLFNDKLWGLGELTYCTNYYFHGKGEAALIKNRLNEYSHINSGLFDKPQILSLPSAKHNRIFCDAKKEKSTRSHGEKLNVLFVSSSLIPEIAMVSPSFKLGNTLTLESQLNVFKTLRSKGYKVFLKSHPKGIQFKDKQDHPLMRLADGALYDNLTPETISHFDVLLFDFAGSAFMDCMLMQKGVVLLDSGVREFAQGAKELLSERISIVNGFQNTDGFLRYPLEALESALQYEAKRLNTIDVSEAFLNTYFG